MKKKFLTGIIATTMVFMVGCGANSTNANSEKEKTEATNGDMAKEQRVVGGTVALTEIMDDLGVELVGRPSTKQELKEHIKKLPEIGKPMSPDVEKVKSLNPDLFVSTNSIKDNVEEKLKNGNVNCEFYDLDSFDNVKNTIDTMSEKFGKEEKGDKILKEYDKIEKEVLDSINGKESKKVMIIFGTPKNIMLATEGSFTGDLVKKLNCKNIVSEKTDESYVPFNIEAAIKENPDVILRLSHVDRDKTKAMFDKEFKENPQWQNFRAVKEGQVYDLDKNLFGVSGTIEAIDSLEKMRDYLYGEK